MPLMTEQFSLMVAGAIIITLRVYVRWVHTGPSKWQLDDYLMPIVGAIFAVTTVTAYFVIGRMHGLTNAMSDEERSTISPSSEEYSDRQSGSRAQIMLWSFYAFILWALKVCVAVFYSRLTSGLPFLQQRLYIAYILLGTTYVAAALTILLSCWPISKFWQITPNPGSEYLSCFIFTPDRWWSATLTIKLDSCQPAVSRPDVFVVMIPTIFINIYLLSIPLPLFWKISISRKRKFTLIALFSGAIWSMAMGLIRAVIILQAGPGVVESGSAWACRETFVAIAVTNLPILHPWLRKCARKLGLTAAMTTKNSQRLSSLDKQRGYHLARNGTPTRSTTYPPGCSLKRYAESSQGRNTIISRNNGAWDSSEGTLSISRSLTQHGIGLDLPCRGIVVDKEVHITSEPAAVNNARFSDLDVTYRASEEQIWESTEYAQTKPIVPRALTRSVRIGTVSSI
ncbi:hypothetical protein F5Y11DRAFT_343819 [Daldinia sp. FL1419]|nr:hypothetical protein F5Y11DRAFT_343819 [Daldinia sp. FL1419]